MNSSIFIENEDLVKLTGTKIRKLQVAHLVKSDIPFKQDRNGYPLVLLNSITASTLATSKTAKRQVRVNPTPLNNVKENNNG